MRFHDIGVRSEDRRTKILLDGKELVGVRSIEFKADVESVPVIKLEMYAGFELDMIDVTTMDNNGEPKYIVGLINTKEDNE